MDVFHWSGAFRSGISEELEMRSDQRVLDDDDDWRYRFNVVRPTTDRLLVGLFESAVLLGVREKDELGLKMC